MSVDQITSTAIISGLLVLIGFFIKYYMNDVNKRIDSLHHCVDERLTNIALKRGESMLTLTRLEERHKALYDMVCRMHGENLENINKIIRTLMDDDETGQ